MKRLIALALLLAGCSAQASTAPAAPATPAFDVGAVQASFTDECASPIMVDELFCDQVVITGMTGDGDILNVPTRLNAASTDRAAAICRQLVVAHFDGEGRDLGYRYIGILDKDGGHAAACSVS